MPRDLRVQIMVTAEQRAAIKKMAHKAEKSMSNFLLDFVFPDDKKNIKISVDKHT